MRHSRWLVLAAASLSFPGVALAGGYAYPDNGVEALGRAGAFAAKADDGTAIYYNPAGLADQDGLRILANANLVNNSLTFQRMDFSGGTTGTDVGPAVSNNGGMFLGPFVAVSYQIIPHLTVALGIYGPPADGQLSFPGETIPVLDPNKIAALITGQPSPGADYNVPTGPGSDPQKYNLISNNIFIAYPTLSLAYAPIKYLSLGVSGQMVYATTQITEAVFDGATTELGGGTPHSSANEVSVWDTIANIKVGNNPVAKFAGIFGIMIRPIDMIRIGASYRPGFRIDQSGTMTLNYSTLDQFAGAQMQGPGTTNSGCNNNTPQGCTSATGPATFSLPVPGDFKSGVDFDFGQGRDIELDFNYMQWSQAQQLVLVPNFSIKTELPSPTTTNVQQVNIPLGFQDTWTLRLGGGYRIPMSGPLRLSVRAGLAYETSVYNSSAAVIYPSLSFANFEEYVGALGVSVGWKWIDLVLGYSHVYEPTVTVKNSGTTMSQNLPGNVAPKNFQPVGVGNGTYASAYDILGIGLNFKFF